MYVMYIQRADGHVVGENRTHVQLRNLAAEFGEPIVDLVLAKKREMEEHCPSGYVVGRRGTTTNGLGRSRVGLRVYWSSSHLILHDIHTHTHAYNRKTGTTPSASSSRGESRCP